MSLLSQVKQIRQQQSKQSGFTLIEVLLVVAIIAILAGIVIIAINPTKQLGDSRNAARQTDVTTILDAVYQYSIDNQGTLPAGITATTTDICGTHASDCTGLVNLSVLSNNGKYVVSLPHDPKSGSDTGNTDYSIVKDANNRVTVSAPDAEQGAIISATR